jgi:hypothetical protein
VSGWARLPGDTPIDVSGLKRKGIATRAELNQAEAENIRKVEVIRIDHTCDHGCRYS